MTPSRRSRSLFSNVAVISLLSGLGMVAALGVHLLLAFLAGVSIQADAFVIANTIPVFIKAIFASSTYALVSVFSRTLASQHIQEAQHFFRVVLSLMLLLLVGITVVISLLAPWLVFLLSPGASAATHAIATDLLRILVWMVPFLGVSTIGNAMLNADNHFTIAGSADLIQYSAPLFVGLLFPEGGVYSISAGLLVGTMVQLPVVMIACYWQSQFVYRPCFNYRYAGMRETVQLLRVAVQGVLMQQSTPLTDRLVASFLPPGSISLLQYGYRLTIPTSHVFFTSIISVTMPTLSGKIARGDADEVTKFLHRIWRLVSFVALPLVVLLVALNEPLVYVLYDRGAFANEAVLQVMPLFLIYNVSLLFHGHVALQHAYFYASSAKKRVLQLFASMMVVDIATKAALVLFVGILAPALAFTASHALAMVLGIILVSSDRTIPIVRLVPFDGGMLIAALLMGLATYGTVTGIYTFVPVEQVVGAIRHGLAIAGGAAVGSMLFAGYVLLWRRAEMREIYGSLKVGKQ